MHIDAAEHPVKLGSVPTETLGPRALMQADRIVGHPCPDPGEDQDWLYVGGPPIPLFEDFNGAKLIGQDGPVLLPLPIVRA